MSFVCVFAYFGCKYCNVNHQALEPMEPEQDQQTISPAVACCFRNNQGEEPRWSEGGRRWLTIVYAKKTKKKERDKMVTWISNPLGLRLYVCYTLVTQMSLHMTEASQVLLVFRKLCLPGHVCSRVAPHLWNRHCSALAWTGQQPLPCVPRAVCGLPFLIAILPLPWGPFWPVCWIPIPRPGPSCSMRCESQGLLCWGEPLSLGRPSHLWPLPLPGRRPRSLWIPAALPCGCYPREPLLSK